MDSLTIFQLVGFAEIFNEHIFPRLSTKDKYRVTVSCKFLREFFHDILINKFNINVSSLPYCVQAIVLGEPTTVLKTIGKRYKKIAVVTDQHVSMLEDVSTEFEPDTLVVFDIDEKKYEKKYLKVWISVCKWSGTNMLILGRGKLDFWLEKSVTMFGINKFIFTNSPGPMGYKLSLIHKYRRDHIVGFSINPIKHYLYQI
jgi:hypothetical protein